MLSRAPVAVRYVSLALAGVIVVGAGFVAVESHGSFLQSRILTQRAQNMAYAVQPGRAADAQFPTSGPFDERLGYTAIPGFVDRLVGKGFTVEQQAAPSEEMHAFVRKGGYALYREKNQAGLKIVDRTGQPIYAKSFPQFVYPSFKTVPRLMADTLLFIEDRDLLDERFTRRNPAVSWNRFVAAAAARVPGLAEMIPVRGGASTLATQIEKFRHSPGGRTGSAEEKLTQMLTASLRAYMDGPDTRAARQRILVTYLNSTPLGSRPGIWGDHWNRRRFGGVVRYRL